MTTPRSLTSNIDLLEPEVHLIGEIVGSSGFDDPGTFCAFEIKRGKEWQLVGGDEKGQTQVDYPEVGIVCNGHGLSLAHCCLVLQDEEDMTIWNHPIDLHYYTKSLQGWPKLVIEVWKLDSYSQKKLGANLLPSLPWRH